MLQYWEKEATQKNKKQKTSKATLLKWKRFLKLHFWKQLSNESYYGGSLYINTDPKHVITHSNVFSVYMWYIFEPY